jgi:hypothetical protein
MKSILAWTSETEGRSSRVLWPTAVHRLADQEGVSSQPAKRHRGDSHLALRGGQRLPRCLGQRVRQALETTLFGPRKPCGALSMLDDAKRLALGNLCTRRRAGVPSHRQCTFFAGGPTRLRWRPCVLFCILTRARDVAPIPVDASAVRRTPSPKRARTRDTSGHTRRRRNPKHFVCHLWQCVAFVSVPL